MNNFIVSARKYRPDTFSSVMGQDSITATLKNTVRNKHLGHAYLFCGPRGVGKTTCARIFAKTINCSNITSDYEPCNKCESCVSFNEMRAFNIHELDAASNNSVEDIRNLTDRVRIPPQVSKYSIYIIDEVHMLSAQAFNAFLKTLEEPPSHAIFILATTEKQKIIPTILSRCQIFDFNRIRVHNIVTYIEKIASKEGIEYEPDALNIIALKADGAMRDALSIFDQMVSYSGKKITYKDVIENLNILDYDYYFRITDAFLTGKVNDSLLIFNEILNEGFDGHNFIIGLGGHFRDLLVCRDPETLVLLETGATISERYKEQSQRCDPDFLYKSLDICSTSDIYFKASRNQKLHVELAMIKLCQIVQVKENITPVTGPVKEESASPRVRESAGEKEEESASPRVRESAGEKEEESASPRVRESAGEKEEESASPRVRESAGEKEEESASPRVRESAGEKEEESASPRVRESAGEKEEESASPRIRESAGEKEEESASPRVRESAGEKEEESASPRVRESAGEKEEESASPRVRESAGEKEEESASPRVRESAGEKEEESASPRVRESAGEKEEESASPRVRESAGEKEEESASTQDNKSDREHEEKEDTMEGEESSIQEQKGKEIEDFETEDEADEQFDEVIEKKGQEIEEKETENSKNTASKGRIYSSMYSIKDALNGKNNQKIEPEDLAESTEIEQNISTEPFSSKELIQVWNDFAEKIKTTRPRMYNTLKGHLPEIGEGNEIDLVLDNTTQQDDFQKDIKQDILMFLRKGLKNDLIIINASVKTEKSNQTKPYTSEEKFDHMIKKNPDLGKLKQEFNLDFE